MSKHYKSHPSGIEAIEITQYESFLRGNILKYVLRAPYKGSEYEDLLKAAEYLQWEIERVKEERYLKRERLKDLFTRESVFVDADKEEYIAAQPGEEIDWQAIYEKRARINEDSYDYYRAGMTGTKYRLIPFDEIMFPDKCQECDGSCTVCE